MAHIAILLQEFFPADVRVRKEVNALTQSGHSIDLFCLQGHGETLYEVINGVRVHRTPLSKKRGSKLRYILEYFIFFMRARTWLRKLVKQKKVDIVHVHTLPDFLVFAAAPAKRKGARVILDMHEITPEFFMSKYNMPAGNPLIGLLRWAERKSLEYADHVITVNKQLQGLFFDRAKLKNDIVILLNTVDDDELPRVPKQPQKKRIGIYHGTLTALYNLEFAVRAMKKIEKELSGFEFHIYGSGTQSEELAQLIVSLQMGHIVFLKGRVSHTEIPDILSRSDIGILPMRKDVMTDLSFSNKIAEYVHCSIPVLSSNLTGIREYLPPDTIRYYQHNDENDFNKNLLEMIRNYEKSREYAARAMAVYEKMNWGIMKKRLLELVSGIKS